jgi:hypothetical protein
MNEAVMPRTRFGQAVKAAILAFTFFTIVPNLVGHSWLAWYKMSKIGRQTDAIITKLEPENHNGCRFDYVINMKRYDGWASGCAQYGLGSALKITYFPDDPSFSTAKEAQSKLLFLVLAPFLMSAIGGIMVYLIN